MARVITAVCRLCRAQGEKLFLKGTKCYNKCTLDRKNSQPGQHGKSRAFNLSEYKLQLNEKQKARRIAGILEKQFRLYFKRADQKKGLTGENLLQLLELRLDNVVLRLGFATSKAQARQLVTHGGVLIDGKKVNIPSYTVKIGNKISLTESRKRNTFVQEGQKMVGEKGLPSWLDLNKETFTGTVLKIPQRADLSYPVREQLIVELYSK